MKVLQSALLEKIPNLAHGFGWQNIPLEEPC